VYSENQITLINPRTGDLAFKIGDIDRSTFSELQRLSNFSVIWVKEGNATLVTGFSEYQLPTNSIIFFSPYRPFLIRTEGELNGEALHFHSDFFCIYKHDKEVGCNGVLFNNIFDPPFITLPPDHTLVFNTLFSQLKEEMKNEGLSQYELLVSYLKIFLVKAVRLKAEQNPALAKVFEEDTEPFILQKLKDHIEEHFRKKHAPNEYANLLNISPKALGKLTKNHFNRTLTSMIADRIVIEAKRELYLTSKPIKEIAFDLGFSDEYYFSRFFKNNADISPQGYRETVGYAKAEEG
jgi:AraC family transcriptional regulator, transcriptional activator of pobA